MFFERKEPWAHGTGRDTDWPSLLSPAIVIFLEKAYRRKKTPGHELAESTDRDQISNNTLVYFEWVIFSKHPAGTLVYFEKVRCFWRLYPSILWKGMSRPQQPETYCDGNKKNKYYGNELRLSLLYKTTEYILRRRSGHGLSVFCLTDILLSRGQRLAYPEI